MRQHAYIGRAPRGRARLDPKVDASQLFINHTLNNRDSSLIYFFARANFESQELGTRINAPFTVRPDGTGLTRHDTFIGGHPEVRPSAPEVTALLFEA